MDFGTSFGILLGTTARPTDEPHYVTLPISPAISHGNDYPPINPVKYVVYLK
jgi:hypothetical protein